MIDMEDESITTWRDWAFIAVGLVVIMVICAAGCTLDTSGLNTESSNVETVNRPTPQPTSDIIGNAVPGEKDASGVDALPDRQGTPVSMETRDSGVPDTTEVRGSMADDASTRVDGTTQNPPGCVPGALYPCDTGLCPCP